jgi:hypothetical protein
LQIQPPSNGPNLASRIITGPVLVVAGIAIYAGLALLRLFPPKDLFHGMGVLLGAEAYAIVAGLFVLTGLQYTLGPRSWISRRITGSVARLLWVAAVMGLVAVGACAAALW